MSRNPADVFRAGPPGEVFPDAAATRFVHLTIDVAGRILACEALDPSERRAVLHYVIATRTRPDEQRALGLLLKRMDLLGGAAIVLSEQERPPVVDILSNRFAAGFSTPEVQALAAEMIIGLRPFLILAWAVALVRAVPGQALPRLEDLDADLPWMPPMGPPPVAAGFDARAALAGIETGEPDRGQPPLGHRRGGC